MYALLSIRFYLKENRINYFEVPGTPKDFVKSMARLISSFYVVNVEYPSKERVY